jgi:8-amino-7-oxononanoate synthase
VLKHNYEKMTDEFLHKKINERREKNAFRVLKLPDGKVDFCSNDYLGIAKNNLLQHPGTFKSGSTGSRLLSGNYSLIEETEQQISSFHQSDAALIYNSGYDANVGLLSCIAQRGDTILYDYLCHASIRDGIRLSFADSFSFRHNDPADLEEKLKKARQNVFVVTETVFSMDGDIAPLKNISLLCEKHGAHLIIDEAHATGVMGDEGEGLVQCLGLQNKCFARVHTFGKALGCHGAVVLGSETLRNYLINFSRAFVYTTALPEASVASIQKSYSIFPSMQNERLHLRQLVRQFQQLNVIADKETSFRLALNAETPIQILMLPGNSNVKSLAVHLQSAGLDVRPILYPTVPKGGERLRIVFHAFNTMDEVKRLAGLLEGYHLSPHNR